MNTDVTHNNNTERKKASFKRICKSNNVLYTGTHTVKTHNSWISYTYSLKFIGNFQNQYLQSFYGHSGTCRCRKSLSCPSHKSCPGGWKGQGSLPFGFLLRDDQRAEPVGGSAVPRSAAREAPARAVAQAGFRSPQAPASWASSGTSLNSSEPHFLFYKIK